MMFMLLKIPYAVPFAMPAPLSGERDIGDSHGYDAALNIRALHAGSASATLLPARMRYERDAAIADARRCADFRDFHDFVPSDAA